MRTALDTELIKVIRERPLTDRTDLEVAAALTRLLIEEFRAYGTGGGNK